MKGSVLRELQTFFGFIMKVQTSQCQLTSISHQICYLELVVQLLFSPISHQFSNPTQYQCKKFNPDKSQTQSPEILKSKILQKQIADKSNKSNMQKGRKFAGITENLNKQLKRTLDGFAAINEWADIKNWLQGVQTILKENPSPYITEKVLLSKRLNQCINPKLPGKIHEMVLKIHGILFQNMRASVDGDINQYIRLFVEDLGIYSMTILPYFAQASKTKYRLLCLDLIRGYYLDLGKQLIPMLSGIVKSILPVYGETNDSQLLNQIQNTLEGVMAAAGRKYFVGCLWSAVLKFGDCRSPGLNYLGIIIPKMDFIKGEEDFSDSHGFSEEQEELLRQMQMEEAQDLSTKPQKKKRRGSVDSMPSINKFPVEQIEVQTPMNVEFQKEPLKELGKILEENQEDNSESHVSMTFKDRSRNQIPSDGHLNDHSTKIPSAFKEQHNREERNIYNSIALNKVPLMLTPGIESISKDLDSNLPEINFPNSNTLVVNALTACLDDSISPLTRRSALDFMFSHLRLKSSILQDGQRRVLIEAAVRLFRKKEISLMKRVNRWLFGKEDEENRFAITQKNQFVIPLLIEALKQILSTEPKTEDDCAVPLKILQNFYIEHPHLVELTLSEVCLHLLRYIFNYGSGFEFSHQITKAGQRFLQNLPSYYPIILRSMGKLFVKGVSQCDDHACFQTVKYIDFCYINLMRHEHDMDELEYLTGILQDLSEGLQVFSKTQQFHSSYMKEAVLLTYNLLARRESVLRFMQKQQEKVNRSYLQETGLTELPAERVDYQMELQKQAERQEERYIEILNRVEAFFIRLGAIIKVNPRVQAYEETFKVSSLLIVKIQYHLPRKAIQTLPNWFQTIESGIRVSNPVISLAAIQAMIKCLMSEGKHPIYNSFKNLILAQKNKKVGNDYQKLALEKLWSLLDFPHMHTKIIDLIVAFSKYFPYEFTDTVKRSFSTHSVPEKEASIQRFSHFWRLTGFKYKDLLLSNRQFAELNKVGLFLMLDFLDDQNPLVRHAARKWLMESMPLFYRVLEPLFSEFMKACKDWYQTPKGICLIKQAYDTRIVFDSFRRVRSILSHGSYSFLQYIYQTQISDSLEQAKANVTDLQGPVVTDDPQAELISTLVESVMEREPVLPKILQKSLNKEVPTSRRMAYMDLLLVLCVKYIEGQALESMGVDFYVGNSGVNTSAIQLIQSLINYIDSPLLCRRIINFILEPLFKVLNQVVVNKEYIIQIQLLNLFRNIIINSSFRKKGELQDVRGFFKDLFTNANFVPSILKGLNTPFSYVRGQFISFLTSCIPLIADFLEPEECTKCIKQILVAYYRIIKEIKINLVEEVLNDEENRVDKAANLALSRIAELEMKSLQEEKMVRLTDNLQQVAKTNEILSVLFGVSEILRYFYDLDKLDIKSLQFQFTNPYTIFDTFKSIITFGLSSSQKDGKLVSRTNFLHNLDTCQSILKDLSPVYQTILRAWPLSEEYVRIATEQFSAIGMRSFDFQRFNKYNGVLADLIEYVEQQKQSIWGKIFSIMQPMFYRFPMEITDIYLKLWVRESPQPNQKGEIIANVQKTEFLMKIVQTVIVNNFPINVVIHAFLETETVREISSEHQKNLKENKKGTILDYRMSSRQAKVLYFLYVYFHYVHLDENALTKDSLLEIWSTIMKAIRPFLSSKSPETALWVLEIINLCSKKYSPKELLHIEKFKSDLHSVIKEKLKFIASVASKKQYFFFENPIKSDFDSNSLENKYRTILPLPPCLYDIYRRKIGGVNSTDKMMFKTVRPGDDKEIERRIRLVSFKALKSIGLELIQNTYAPEKNQWVVARTCEWVQILLPSIQDKSNDNMLFAESASEILYDLLDKARSLFIKPLRLPILKIFNKDDFFICNRQTLNYWAKIIDWVVGIDNNNQTFSEYLEKVTLSNSFFTSESTENKKRIKSFERICFLLYSGGRDQYALKIRGLLQKIAEVIRKSEQAHPALLILILFSVRILILRLSEISLNQLFLDIWPMLLALLMQLFTKNMVRVEMANEISKNPNLLLAALKLLEMISLTNLSSFAHHQWIFIFDYFGVKLMTNESAELLAFLAKRPQLANQIQISRTIQEPPFIYAPYLSNYFPHFSIDYVPKKGQQVSSFKSQTRKIIIQDSFVEDENQLKVRALALAQYLTKINEYRTEIKAEEIEAVIVHDFITLDKFIHNI